MVGIIAVVVLIILLVATAVLVLRKSRGLVKMGGGAHSAAKVKDATGDAGVVDWPAPPRCYPASLVGELLRVVRSVPGFGPLTDDQRRALERGAKHLSNKYGVPLRTEQLVSIRTMEAALEAQRAGIRALRQGKKIAEAVAAGRTVLEVAAELKLPPLAVLKQALLEQGFSEANVRSMIASPATLPEPLASEATGVFEADLSSRLHAERAKTRSQEYENAVEEYLRAAGASFQTEDELRAEQIIRYGAPRLTPDFLFREPVRIHGHSVRWLDAKNYPMYGGKIAAKSIARQAVKYTEAFGPGAMVFSGGLVCDLNVLPKKSGFQPLLLDGSFIAVH